jgi:3-oxoacyl-[acyl-carrier protein] reductase
MRLEGRVAAVTGGASGIGEAICIRLAAEGARVAVVARQSDDLDKVAKETRGVAVAADLTTGEGPGQAATGAINALGGLDGLVVNSGGPPTGTFEQLDEETWRRAIDGTLLAAIRLIRAALPALREGREPAIVIVLSSSIREPVPGIVTSNVLRPGLNGLIKTLVGEIAPIRINGIAPGRIDTARIRSLDASRAKEMGIGVDEVKRTNLARIPLARYGEAAEVGRVGAFLLSTAASYVDGVVIGVDGGMIRSLP